MSELRAWLHSHNLEHCAEAFEANDIDLDILAELTDRDLVELGLSLGNRRRLLKAIAAKRVGGDAVQAEAAPPSATAGSSPVGEAERRQVTVLFCDLVGSTALSSAVDPEMLGPLLRRYQDAAAGAVSRFGGFVAKFLGDGVLAYFGFPQAFEDAAERAVRAGLAILAEMEGLAGPYGERLQARIGIATGLVVVGEIIGAGSAREHSIVGETPNLAARLQALAAPDTILLSEATQRLIGGLFDLELLPPQAMKGFARPVSAWRVAGEAVVASRFAAIRAGASVPMVGRAHEMGLLLDRWRLAAHAGEGQIVTLIGEPGIGKSRAIEALQEVIAGELPHTRIHLQCSAYHSDSALYPVIQHLARAARFAAEDPPARRLEKLAALFARRTASDPAALPLLAELLSLPADGTLPEPSAALATPAQRRAATIRLLVDEVIALSDDDPLLFIVEDAQWIDATTVELLTCLAESIGGARVLALVTARPDFAPPWLGRPQASVLTLGRLGAADCAAIVASVAASYGLAAEIVAAIVAKTDGVPLFAEELTKSVVEAAGQAGSAVPSTLQDSLMARLDRLGEAREAAQIAAVIGRQFDLGLLAAAVAPRPAAEIEAALAKLVTAGILFPHGRHGNAGRGFTFKHALLRDAAYESLLLARRREWHARIARALECEFPETAATEPDLLAHHFGEAGLPGKACTYRERAGDRAAARSAYREAIAHYRAGIAEAEKLADTDESRRRQLALLVKLGPACTIIGGAQSAEVADAFGRAAVLADALRDASAAYRARWGLWLNANLGRRTAAARDRADELVALAEQAGNEDLLLEAHHCRWSTALFRGEVALGRQFGRAGAAVYDIARHRHLGHEFGGHDPGVCAHAVLGLMAAMSDESAEARREAERAIALGEQLDHPNSLAHALYNAAMEAQITGDVELTAAMAERTIAVADKYGLPPNRAGGAILAAWSQLRRGNPAEIDEAVIERAAAVGPNGQYLLGVGGELMLELGRFDAAMALFDRALTANEEPEVGYYLAEIQRLRGHCLLALDRGNKSEARQAFTTARDIARRQGAVLLERRAEASLAEASG